MMGDLLGDGLAWLNGVRHAHMSVAATYIHAGTINPGLSPIRLQATIGRTDFEEVDAAGAIHRIESRDYIMRAADLVIDGARFVPLSGDTIEQVIGSKTCIFAVSAPAKQMVYRYTDPQRTGIRVHTKKVSET